MQVAKPVRMTPAEREAYALGRQRFERGDAPAALDALEDLARTRSDFADVHYMIGVLQDAEGNLEPALTSLERAVALNPGYIEALLALASVHERMGDFDRSRELAERAASGATVPAGTLDATTRGKLANLQAEMGDAYAEVGELREAIEAYRKALDRCPEFHDIRHRLGIALREGGLPQKALHEFQRVLRGNPSFLPAHIQLGLTYYSLGRPQAALEQWALALQQDPALEEAHMYTRLLQSAARTKAEGAATTAPDSDSRPPEARLE